MTKKNNRKIIGIILAGAIACTAVFSLAFFTDIETNVDDPMNVGIAQKNLEIVPVDPSDPDPTPEDTPKDDPSEAISFIWNANNNDFEDIVAPGDMVSLDYTILNGGPGAMDIRETFVLTSTVDMSDWDTYEAAVKANGGADVADKYAPEYWLFQAAQADANGAFGYYGSTQIDNVKVTKIDAKTYKFEVPAFILNGTSEKVDGGLESKQLKYEFNMDKYARNDFQGSKCTVDYLVEAKQHTYADPSKGWAEVASVDVTLGAVTVKAVPGDGQ